MFLPVAAKDLFISLITAIMKLELFLMKGEVYV